MPANLENSAVATRLEEVSFHSSPKEGHATVITEFWGESDWRQITFYFVMNSVWTGIKLVVVLKMLYFAYKANTLSKRTCVCRFLQYCRKVFTDFFKCLCIWSIWLQIIPGELGGLPSMKSWTRLKRLRSSSSRLLHSTQVWPSLLQASNSIR